MDPTVLAIVGALICCIVLVSIGIGYYFYDKDTKDEVKKDETTPTSPADLEKKRLEEEEKKEETTPMSPADLEKKRLADLETKKIEDERRRILEEEERNRLAAEEMKRRLEEERTKRYTVFKFKNYTPGDITILNVSSCGFLSAGPILLYSEELSTEGVLPLFFPAGGDNPNPEVLFAGI